MSLFNRALFLVLGIVARGLVTLLMRELLGAVVFQPDNDLLLALFYAITGLGVLALVRLLLAWRNIAGAARAQATLLLAFPGLLLDALIVQSFANLMPPMTPAMAAPYAAWLLWAYALALLAALLPQRFRKRATD